MAPERDPEKEKGTGRQSSNSQLFLLRVWQEDGAQGIEWQGKVQHVLSNKVGSFTGWQSLSGLITEILSTNEERQEEYCKGED